MQRRNFIQTASAFGAGLALPAFTQAQDLSTIRILVGFPAGGTADALARRIAEKLRGGLAANVVVENKPGAGGQIAVSTLKTSSPDGRTMLLTPSSMLSIYPFTYPKLPYKVTDVSPLSVCAYFSHAFGVGPAVPASVLTMKDFMTWARQDSTRANFGSPAAGSMPHMIASYVFKSAGQDVRHIPYRGGAPGIQDLLGGQISAMCAPVGEFLPYVSSGKLRLLAISSRGRSPFARDVATFREQGIPITSREWYGLHLPNGVSPELQRRIAAYLQAALTQPDLIAGAASVGLEVESSSPTTAMATLQADADEWQRLIKVIGFTAES